MPPQSSNGPWYSSLFAVVQMCAASPRRAGVLCRDPICKLCHRAATEVDHIVPHNDDETRFEEAIVIPKPVSLDAGRKGRSARRAENDRPYTPSRSSWLARLSWSCLDVGGLGHVRRCLLDLSTHRMVEEEKEGKVNHRQLKQAIRLIPRRTK